MQQINFLLMIPYVTTIISLVILFEAVEPNYQRTKFLLIKSGKSRSFRGRLHVLYSVIGT